VSFVEDGLPNKYCNFLREHGFNVFDHTMTEFVEFVETPIEPIDAKEDVKKEESSKKGNKRKNKDLKDSKIEEKKSRKHQFSAKYNNTHATEDCRFSKFQKNNKDQTNENSRGNTGYVSKEGAHAMMQDVAEASAKAAIKKATAVWKRKHEENHAVEAVNSTINNLELDCEENSASDILANFSPEE